MRENKPAFVDGDTAVLPHRVLQPNTPDPHPTIVMIHGHLGNEEVMWIFRQTLPEDWLVVAPRAIVDDGDGRYSWHPRQQDEWPSLKAFDTAVDTLLEFLDALPNLYNADPHQIYLMGFSQRAAASFSLAIREPQRVQGIASQGGGMPLGVEEARATARLADLPVFMAVGTEDERIPLEVARECGKAVRAAGAYLEYREYDTGHKLNGDGMRKLKSWWVERAAGAKRP